LCLFQYLGAGPVSVEIITYVCFSLTLLCLIIAFLIFRCLPRLAANTNSILINLVFCIFITLLIYLIGIDQVNSRVSSSLSLCCYISCYMKIICLIIFLIF